MSTEVMEGIEMEGPDREEGRGLAWSLSPVRLGVVAAVLAVAMAGVWYWAHGFETTEDAYVTGHIHALSFRVPGVVREVLIRDNQEVREGQELVKLDDTDHAVRLEQARALQQQAEAALEKAQNDFERAEALRAAEFRAISEQDYDAAKAGLDVARAQLTVARTQVRDAELQLSYTVLRAPAAGRVGKRTAEVGQRVMPGQQVVAVVNPQVWVVANFKETQIGRMAPGQRVVVEVDALPGRRFEATLDSLAPASGAQFALLPPDNATGNFTKIVQRIPVKVVFEAESAGDDLRRLSPGMSTHVKVFVR